MTNKSANMTQKSPKEKRMKMPLTNEEKKVAKNLLNKNMPVQDIANLISIGRKNSVNMGRISDVKNDNTIQAASDEKTEEFIRIAKATDLNTGLNPYKDERIIRSRESMILAVQLYNNPVVKFKAEFFSILAIAAWSYLLVEYYIVKKGHSFPKKIPSINRLMSYQDCPLDKATKKNIEYINKIRNAVSHGQEMGNIDADSTQSVYYQTCCSNFNERIKDLLNESYGLERELSTALQFSKFDFHQAEVLSNYNLPKNLRLLRENFEKGLSPDILTDVKYKHNLVTVPEELVQREINYNQAGNVGKNIKEFTGDDIEFLAKKYSYKPGEIVIEVVKKTGKRFTSHNHTVAWKKYKVRPDGNAKGKDKSITQKEWCYYFGTTYLYTQKWVDFLIQKVNEGEDLHNL